jgi:broad specificity phosphatase PhoE
MVIAGIVRAVPPETQASLGLTSAATPTSKPVDDPKITDTPLMPSDQDEKKPFTAMEGMFAYDSWSQSLFEETQDERPLLQQLPKYGAAVDWSKIKSSINSGIGKRGQRKLFLFVRHGKALHNEWGTLQHHTYEPEDIPCDFKKPGDLVDPELTESGRKYTTKYVRDVFKNGLGGEIGKRVKIFTSPLSRCMETTLIMLRNQTGLEVADERVTVSELLRERIDARVPFELRRPVSFIPKSVFEAEARAGEAGEAEKAAAVRAALRNASVTRKSGLLSGYGGAGGPGGMCWEPSKGLSGHEGTCCLDAGLLEKFGDTGVFDIKVATPSFLNVQVMDRTVDLILENTTQADETGESIAHDTEQLKDDDASCGLTEVAKKGWQECTGPEMLGLLAENDLALGSEEESESALVERVRTWFSSVYDHVDENVIIAVTHSDWIKLAMRELDIKKPWVVTKNSEIFPIIVEDARASVPGWIEKREARKRQLDRANEEHFVTSFTNHSGVHEKVLDALKESDEAAAEAAEAAAVERRAAKAAKAAAEKAKTAEVAAQRAIAEAQTSADSAVGKSEGSKREGPNRMKVQT